MPGSIRVIAGEAGGRILRAPPGGGTRPTSGRLREALFAMLEAIPADFSEVLDLYAGSGALGIEALSRGAEHATFIEQDPGALGAVRGNLGLVGFAERATVVRGRVGGWRPPEGVTYTLVVADPPYDDAAAWGAIERTVRGHVARDAVLVVEHSARRVPPPMLAGLPLWRDRRQGEGAVALYRTSRAADEGSGEDG
ncbi:MAG: 16S rRNA (guanine(966)-N(2))-methyltransferase RsmD [Dehalococcoidia bacterium]|nr:16S rRNA (guanine(966)-N(2))-methyltransferase RsmD [Dehalococcoidia bacterium]